MEYEEKLCNDVETVRESTYAGDRVSTGGRCEVDVPEQGVGGLSLGNTVSS